MSKLTATWSITLDTTCPGCNEDVDLLDYEDFWDGRRIEAGEWGTPATTDIEVICPRCGHEFKVDLEY
jgi:hypothetical protein